MKNKGKFKMINYLEIKEKEDTLYQKLWVYGQGCVLSNIYNLQKTFMFFKRMLYSISILYVL